MLVTQTPDPTSIDFETLFKELCSDGLREPERRLVLVIENLDRVSPEDALAIWSALQRFVQHGAADRPAWARQLWIIVPFDPAGISRLWVGYGREADTAATVSLFLDKTFQIRFQIPTPTILYFRDYLRTALTHVGQRLALQFGGRPLQHTCLGPTVEPHVDCVPVAELARQAAPGAALIEHVEPGVQHLTMGDLEVIARWRQQRLQPHVLRVAQLLLVAHQVTRTAPPTVPTLPQLRPEVKRP